MNNDYIYLKRLDWGVVIIAECEIRQMRTGVHEVALKNVPILVKQNTYLSTSSRFIFPL